MKKKKVLLRVLLILWLCVIWGHSLMPATVSQGESGRFLEIIGKVLPALAQSDIGMFIVRKSAHFAEYFLLGVLMCMEFKDRTKGFLRRFFEPELSVLFVAFIDETIQLFVPGRSGQVSDMWIDFAGGALGVLIVLAVAGSRR